jgi:sugar lactone lactonase YvrE
VDTYVGIYRFDLSNGVAHTPRLLVKSGDAPGHPDGLTVDADGCLWVALALGSHVARITPEGRIDRMLPVPATFVTSCTFGGPGLDTLFITSARAGRPAAELANEPHAGALFAAHVGRRGLPEVAYGGSGPTG